MNTLIKIIKTGISVLLIGGMGVLLCQTKAGTYMEEEFGLEWLFKFRGSLPPPADVVIVSIDKASAEILHLPDDPEKWPHTFYAGLIDKLNQQKAAIIAFNIHFGESREPENDALLAKAMAANRNVILSNYLKQYTVPGNSDTEEIRYERVIEPISVLSQAALGTAPFPLPKTASTVKEFWAYKHSAGDIPTFPVSVFQYFVIKETYPEVLQLLSRIDAGVFARLPPSFDELTREFGTIQVFQDIQSALTKNAESLDEMGQIIAEGRFSAKATLLLQSWLTLLKCSERLYLNHYGDVGSITTIPFYQALTTDIVNTDRFKDKIVLIGYADNLEPEKQQGFYTAFSKASEQVISPIEIAATAIANLIDQSTLRPLAKPQKPLLILVWGIVLSAAFRVLTFKPALICAVLLTGAYVVFSRYLFATQYLWLPLAIPLFQAIIVLLWQSTTYLLGLRRISSSNLPKSIIDRIIRNGGKIDVDGVIMPGVCMATDIEGYTTITAAIGPRKTTQLINDYSEAIYPIITRRKGLMLNNVADSIVAVWTSTKIDKKLRLDACHAALELKAAVNNFNKTSSYLLRTRIGLHYGEMDMSFVGADNNYTFRAVGDTVNTANRIEQLNKELGTRILVSEPVLENLPGLLSRELGAFLLKGKALPMTVFELMGTDGADQTRQQLASAFGKAVTLFKNRQWQRAWTEFLAIHKEHPDDGPTLFYINYLQNNLPLMPEISGKEYTVFIDVGNITNLLH